MPMVYYKYYNSHPKGLIVEDCVKRAICTATEKGYEIVSKELNDIVKDLRKKKQLKPNNFTNNLVWKQYIKNNDYYKIIIPVIAKTSRMTVAKFAALHREGNYILRCAHHLTCVINGMYYDTWDCGGKAVYTAWRVK